MPDTEHYPMQVESGSVNPPTACGAKTRTGAACKNSPVIGKKRCRMHGGVSPSGTKHWNYKHGYWSKEEKQQRSQMMRVMKAYLSETEML